MRYLDVTVDGRTTKLLKVARAAQLNEELPKESARRLVGMARAVRLLVEAAEPDFAKTVVDDIEKLVNSAESDPWIVMVTRHLELVRKCL